MMLGLKISFLNTFIHSEFKNGTKLPGGYKLSSIHVKRFLFLSYQEIGKQKLFFQGVIFTESRSPIQKNTLPNQTKNADLILVIVLVL